MISTKKNIIIAFAGIALFLYEVKRIEHIKTGKIVDTNTMMFVAIHELAHLMTKSIGHTPEFWNNMKYLLQKAIKIGIYTAVDYKSKPVPYCGTTITDSPL